MGRLGQQHWRILAPFLIVVASVFWGMIGLFSNSLTKAGLSALQITEGRCFVSAAILGFFLLLTNRKYLKIKLPDLWLFIGTGVVSIAFFNICYFIAISESTLSIACILLHTSPCFVMLFSCVLFRERFTLRKGIAIILAFVGCMYTTGFINGAGETSITGVALIAGLGSGIGYALYSVIGRVALTKYNWLTLITYTFLFASIALFPFCKPSEILSIAVAENTVILHIVLLGVLSTLLPFLLYTKGLEHMDTGKAALLTFVEPVVATIIGIIVFHEIFTRYIAIGIVLVVLSIVVINYHQNRMQSWDTEVLAAHRE